MYHLKLPYISYKGYITLFHDLCRSSNNLYIQTDFRMSSIFVVVVVVMVVRVERWTTESVMMKQIHICRIFYAAYVMQF